MLDSGIVAVLRSETPEESLRVAAALVRGGITAIELTLSTPGVLASVGTIRDALPPAVALGVGTVTNSAEAVEAVRAGAEFVVTPMLSQGVVRVCLDAGVPVIVGVYTPTEMKTAWDAGCSAVKLFPAVTAGPRYLEQVLAPLPELLVMPSGGVTIDSIPSWIAAGAVALGLGGPLTGAGGHPRVDDLERIATAAVSAVADARLGEGRT